MRTPSLETKEDTNEQKEQHSANPQATSTRINRPREKEKGGSKKKSKATKTSLDPITLMRGILHNISDTVRDVTAEALQQFEQ